MIITQRYMLSYDTYHDFVALVFHTCFDLLFLQNMYNFVHDQISGDFHRDLMIFARQRRKKLKKKRLTATPC